jgi:hypothetical protein
MATGCERTGCSPWFGNPPKQELSKDIEASLEDIVLKKPLLRGVTPEPLSDWRTAGFSNYNQVSFFFGRTLERSFTRSRRAAEGCRPLV